MRIAPPKRLLIVDSTLDSAFGGDKAVIARHTYAFGIGQYSDRLAAAAW